MKEQEEKLDELQDLFRSAAVERDNYLTAIYLLDRVYNNLKEKALEETEHNIYYALLEEADGIKSTNPFYNKVIMVEAYKKLKEIGRLNWENIIEEFSLASSFGRSGAITQECMRLFEKRLDRRVKNVLVANAERFCPFVKTMVDRHNDLNFTLSFKATIHRKIFEQIFKAYENVQIVKDSEKDYIIEGKSFDVVFSNSNAGMRKVLVDENEGADEVRALRRFHSLLGENGRLVFLSYANLLGASDYQPVREQLEKQYKINEINELAGLRFSRVKAYLIDFEKSDGQDYTTLVRKYASSRRDETLTVHDEIKITKEQLQSLGSWNVDKIFALKDEEFLKFHNSPVNKSTLGEVADIFRGKMLVSAKLRESEASSTETSENNVSIINISNLTEDGIDYSEMQKVSLGDRKIANHILQEGDILISARGTVLRSCVFHEQKEKYIASANLIVIRPKADLLDGTYLQLFLTSPIGMKSLKNMQEGTILLNTSAEELQTLLIPLPEIAEQKAKAKEYSDELAAYKTKMQEAEKHWQDVLKKLQEF